MVITSSAVIVPSLLRGEAGLDVVVAGEGVGLQVFGAVFDPLDRLAGGQSGDDGDDVAGVDGHLAAEAAADVGGDDADLRLGDAGDEGEDGADGVRSLGGHPDGELAADLVDLGHAAAGLDGGDVDARDVHVLLDDHVRLRECLVGRG